MNLFDPSAFVGRICFEKTVKCAGAIVPIRLRQEFGFGVVVTDLTIERIVGVRSGVPCRTPFLPFQIVIVRRNNDFRR
jgi:hypothetical protein